MARAEIVPVFIPHGGCPHRCVFCDQHTISGQVQKLSPASVAALFAGQAPNRELAYYGGSFTALERAEMLASLETARRLKAEGRIGVIRLSTHPHYVDDEIIKILQKYTVDIVELGVQSTSEEVLRRSGRGGSRQEILSSLQRLRDGGFTVGAQIMTGLPGASRSDELATARDLVAAAPDLVRIYPTLVLRDTALARLTLAGEYRPAPLAEAIALVRDLLAVFLYHNIRVIRMGLQPTAEICRGSAALLAGPYHESFGYLVQCALKEAQLIMAAGESNGPLVIACPPRERPLIFGDHGHTASRLSAGRELTVTDDATLPAGAVTVNGRRLTREQFLKTYLEQMENWSETCI